MSDFEASRAVARLLGWALFEAEIRTELSRHEWEPALIDAVVERCKKTFELRPDADFAVDVHIDNPNDRECVHRALKEAIRPVVLEKIHAWDRLFLQFAIVCAEAESLRSQLE